MVRLFLAFAFCVMFPHFEAAEVQSIIRPPKQCSYEFDISLEDRLTMTDYSKQRPELIYYDASTKTYKIRDMASSEPCDAFSMVPPTEQQIENIIQADGLHKRVIAMNGAVPGPTIVAYKDSEVILNVANNLAIQPASVHCHGIRMTNNFWNDGAAKVGQFPIMPGQKFTYRFIAERAGTFFCHGHAAVDRGDGLNFALIILEDEHEEPYHQFAMDITDWFTVQTLEHLLRSRFRLLKTPKDYDNFEECYSGTRTFDDSSVGTWKWDSILINGFGWYNVTEIIEMAQMLPLETFVVEKGKQYKFRVIHSGSLFPVLLCIDEHMMEVVAMDGEPIKKVTDIDCAIISTGERIDFILNTKMNPSENAYYITVRTLETEDGNGTPLWKSPHATVAFLSYTNKMARPSQNPKFGLSEMDDNNFRCNPSHQCKIFNCPYPQLGKLTHLMCITLNDLDSAVDDMDWGALKQSYTSHFEEHFIDIRRPFAINGFRFTYPRAPPGLLKENPENFLYDCKDCTTTGCTCTQVLDLTLWNTVQLVFANSVARRGHVHPMHYHGYHAYVTKVAFPEYDENGIIKAKNPDITCDTTQFHSCRWTDPSFKNGNVPDMNLNTPILKDTLPVPPGGYAVIRFWANNPGWWPLHCHLMPHHVSGMALLLHVGTYYDQPENRNAIIFGRGEAKCSYGAVKKYHLNSFQKFLMHLNILDEDPDDQYLYDDTFNQIYH